MQLGLNDGESIAEFSSSLSTPGLNNNHYSIILAEIYQSSGVLNRPQHGMQYAIITDIYSM